MVNPALFTSAKNREQPRTAPQRAPACPRQADRKQRAVYQKPVLHRRVKGVDKMLASRQNPITNRLR